MKKAITILALVVFAISFVALFTEGPEGNATIVNVAGIAGLFLSGRKLSKTIDHE